MEKMKLQDLKAKTPTDLVTFAEGVDVENASTMRKQELMFAILKQLAEQDTEIIGEGKIEEVSEAYSLVLTTQKKVLRQFRIGDRVITK